MSEDIFRGKIKRRDRAEGNTWWDMDKRMAMFQGEQIPAWYPKLVNILNGEQLPVILFLGDPGTGKTEAAASLGYDLHHRLNVCRGDFTAEENIHYDNIDFFESVHNSRRKAIVKPDVNVTMNALDYNDEENRVNEETIHLSRTFSNPLIYDGQYWDRVPKPLRENHTFRLIATGGTHTYAFRVIYVEKAKNEDEDDEQIPLGVWKPNRPPRKIRRFIEEKDEDWKDERLENRIGHLKTRRKEEKEKRQRMTI